MSRFSVKTATFKVAGIEYLSRKQATGYISNTLASYEGIDVIIEEIVEALKKLPQVKEKFAELSEGGKVAITPEKIIGFVEMLLADTDMTLANILVKLVRKAPGLVAQVLSDGVVLQDGETIDEFLDFLDSLTFTEIKDLCVQWYQFNLEGEVGPLVGKLAGKPTANDEAPKVDEAPKPAARRMGRRP